MSMLHKAIYKFNVIHRKKTSDIFHRNEISNPQMSMEPQKNKIKKNSQCKLEEKTKLKISCFLCSGNTTSCSNQDSRIMTQKLAQRSMEQYRDPRNKYMQIWSVQLLSCVQLFATAWITAHQVSLYISNYQSLLKLMSIKSVMPSNISSSVVPFSACLQSFPASGSFPMSQFFTSGGQSIGVSASASVLPMSIQH